MATKRKQQKRAERRHRLRKQAVSEARQRLMQTSLRPFGDGLALLRDRLQEAATERGHWSGVPMPLEGEQLVIEKSHPMAELFNRKPPPPDEAGCILRNAFYSLQRRGTVQIWTEPDGRIAWGVIPGFHGLQHALRTIGCSNAWGLGQEATAMQTLASLIPSHALKQYALTGMFLETSKRSGITYLFRKLRPTVAISHSGGDSRILCVLCMHPIAYYEDSWAGAMVPTDDVIAHLMLMRGDEHMLWKRSNQHPAYVPQAGL